MAKENSDTERDNQRHVFELAADVRKFEIDLFWKRALFFWGFIAAAFVSFADLSKAGAVGLALAIACFGFVCSAAWTLANRGSKYWQEHWEQKVERAELSVFTEQVFAQPEPIKHPEVIWLRARKYSVSKLTIALSDFTAILWFVLMMRSAASVYMTTHPSSAITQEFAAARRWAYLVLPAAATLYVFAMVLKAGSWDQARDKPQKAKTDKSTPEA